VAVNNDAKNMKIFTTSITILLSFAIPALAEHKWTYQAEEGEDATSTHYYFYESNGDSIQRVRWVWNGGAQNPPTVTEYLLGSGEIVIRHLVGKRDDVANLVMGGDVELELKQEYSIMAKSTAEMLIPASPATSLSDTQRIDLKNLIDLLARERKPYKSKEQHDGGGQPATRPGSK
jgi:hypothetical protein